MTDNTNKPQGRPTVRKAADDKPRVAADANAKQKVAAGPAPAGAKPRTAADAAYAAGIAAGAAAAAKAAPKKKTGLIVGIIAAVVVVAAVIVGIVVFSGSGQDDFYDANSIIGQAPYKSEEEIMAELNRIVEEGMMNISIASVIEFEDGQSEGVAYIENVPGNRYVMKVDIKLDDTGETVYESGGLKPGNYIEKIKLNKDLPQGTYSATATFHGLDPDTLEEVGTAGAVITLNVLS